MDLMDRYEMHNSPFLLEKGLWALVDGQFGSTGKGLAASVLAEVFKYRKPDWVVSNAGPNSGHTSYTKDGKKVVLMQLPTFAVMYDKFHGTHPTIHMSAGSVLDLGILGKEVDEHLTPFSVSIDPTAAVITSTARAMDEELISKIGSTGKGVGAALARKVMREPDAVALKHDIPFAMVQRRHITTKDVVFMEVSQGYSLSLNASGMYPFVTSRDCTVTQAMADASIHPSFLRGTMMAVRTFPIRVAGNSGPCYPDQKELTWEELGQEPELTTVTKKVRRVFTWSNAQFAEAVMANRPTAIFINFMNYLSPNKWGVFLDNVNYQYEKVMGRPVPLMLAGFGPNNEDVKVVKL